MTAGILYRQCAWCGRDLGAVPCEPELDGETSHGMCGPCAETPFAQVASEAGESHTLSQVGSTPPPAPIFGAAGEVRVRGSAELHGASGADLYFPVPVRADDVAARPFAALSPLTARGAHAPGLKTGVPRGGENLSESLPGCAGSGASKSRNTDAACATAGENPALSTNLLSSGLPSGDASKTATAAAPLRSAARLSSAECLSQISVTASGQCPPLDSFDVRCLGDTPVSYDPGTRQPRGAA